MIRLLMRVVAAAGLGVDAYVHVDLADRFETVGSGISESTLFTLQAALAALAGLLVLLRGRRLEAGFGALIAAAALGAVLLYRYVDVGTLGPLPDMYDPAWYTEKTISAIAEAVALCACVVLLLLGRRGPGPDAIPAHLRRHAGYPGNERTMRKACDDTDSGRPGSEHRPADRIDGTGPEPHR